MNQEQLIKILIAPHISEKSTFVNVQGQYIFKVLKDAAKPDIKQAVELLFNVKVKSVQVSHVKSKSKRFGQIMGKHKGWKKAYVCLHDGYKIEVAEPQA